MISLLFCFKNKGVSLKNDIFTFSINITILRTSMNLSPLVHVGSLNGWFWSKDIENEDDRSHQFYTIGFWKPIDFIPSTSCNNLIVSSYNNVKFKGTKITLCYNITLYILHIKHFHY